jgi:hypothetical protein
MWMKTFPRTEAVFVLAQSGEVGTTPFACNFSSATAGYDEEHVLGCAHICSGAFGKRQTIYCLDIRLDSLISMPSKSASVKAGSLPGFQVLGVGKTVLCMCRTAQSIGGSILERRHHQIGIDSQSIGFRHSSSSCNECSCNQLAATEHKNGHQSSHSADLVP